MSISPLGQHQYKLLYQSHLYIYIFTKEIKHFFSIFIFQKFAIFSNYKIIFSENQYSILVYRTFWHSDYIKELNKKIFHFFTCIKILIQFLALFILFRYFYFRKTNINMSTNFYYFFFLTSKSSNKKWKKGVKIHNISVI